MKQKRVEDLKMRKYFHWKSKNNEKNDVLTKIGFGVSFLQQETSPSDFLTTAFVI